MPVLGCATFVDMEYVVLAMSWIARHPWRASLALVVLAGTAMAVAFRRRRSKRQVTFRLLRPRNEQAAFKPVSTVYDPRRYRRERKAKN